MEINSTHGEFHLRAGGDEKLKNYFNCRALYQLSRITFAAALLRVNSRAKFSLVVDHVKYEYSIGRSRAAVRHPPGV